MKKILLFALLPLMMAFVSCSDDDNNDNPGFPQEELIGTWEFLQSELGTIDVTPADIKTAIEGDLRGSDYDIYSIEFKAEGVVLVQKYKDQDAIESTYSVNGNQLTIGEDIYGTIAKDNQYLVIHHDVTEMYKDEYLQNEDVTINKVTYSDKFVKQ